MVILYQKTHIPYPHYIDGVIDKVVSVEPKNYILIESKSCACDTRNGIAVQSKKMFVKSKEGAITGSIHYAIDYDTPIEFETAILWLVKSRFQAIVLKHGAFKNPEVLTCGCNSYERMGIPVYCTPKKIVCRKQSGLTIKQVVLDELHSP
jgi:hypothetical protein